METPRRSQYQHYIPRFILRNFRINELRNRNARQHDRKLKDGLLRQVNLTDGTLRESRLSESFGEYDMYEAFTEDHSDRDVYDLESRLSKLEQTVSAIIARIKDAKTAHKTMVTLSRSDKNELRRFIFIMKYRSTTFYERFKKTRETYNARDRDRFLKYMDQEEFLQPVDVWFHNLKVFLEFDLNHDPSYSWCADITSLAYPPDALWFWKNMTFSFIAFITPSEPDDEFVLTQNAYGVFEGPSDAQAWTDWHTFAPISPKLMIVNRSNLLDRRDGTYSRRTERLERLLRNMHQNPSIAQSVLKDLPVAVADNNYSRVVEGQRQPQNPSLHWSKHNFHFEFYKITHHHVQLINSIFFENAGHTEYFIYQTAQSLRSSLEYYFALELDGFKAASAVEEPQDPRYITIKPVQYDLGAQSLTTSYMKRLECVAEKLGSNAKVQHIRAKGQHITPLPVVEEPARTTYFSLGGSPEMFAWDWVQSKLMLELHIKIDSYTQHVDHDVKREVRKTREEFFSDFPPGRVWLYLKNLRELGTIHHKNYIMVEGAGLQMRGVEDELAAAFKIFSAKPFCRLMQRASKLQTVREQRPEFGLTRGLTCDDEGKRKLLEEVHVMFDCGNIGNCGIAKIEESSNTFQQFAEPLMPLVRSRGGIERKIFSPEEHLELKVRREVAKDFENLRIKLDHAALSNLKKTFFELCFRYELQL